MKKRYFINTYDFVDETFTSYGGSYNNNPYSKVCSIDYDLFQKHFIEYLNDNKKDIMLEIANRMKREAKTLKGQAKKELIERLNELEKLI